MGRVGILAFSTFCIFSSVTLADASHSSPDLKKKRSMVWVYGSSLIHNASATIAALAKHTDAFNAVSPQMYSIGCDAATSAQMGERWRVWEQATKRNRKELAAPSTCVPVMISSSSDPGISPNPSLAQKFHTLGVEYWPTLSSPDYLNANGCLPANCGNGSRGRCQCGSEANETATMDVVMADPSSLIESALAEARRWNITGFNIDMEAPAPDGDQAVRVIEFVNVFSAAMERNGIQTSYCIGGMGGDMGLATLLNKTEMRTVPMSLYSNYDSSWLAEVASWKQVGMANKLGVGFCPTCGMPVGGEPNLTQKFEVAAAYNEIDFFAFSPDALTDFEPYWAGMKAWLGGHPLSVYV